MGFGGKFNCNDCVFSVRFGSINVVRAVDLIYAGSYCVTPMVFAQRIETKEKYMRDDLLVHPIPTHEMENDAGGITLVIGGSYGV